MEVDLLTEQKQRLITGHQSAVQQCAIDNLEDKEQPHARQVHEIASDPSVAQELASGAYLIAVPLVTAKNRSVRVNLSLDKGIVEAIDAAAQVRGLSRSSFLAEAAQNEIRGR